jgi:ankyrin repeat protein
MAADMTPSPLRVQTLPHGFVQRPFPKAEENSAWWNIRIAGTEPGKPCAFAAIIFSPARRTASVALEIVLPQGLDVRNPGDVQINYWRVGLDVDLNIVNDEKGRTPLHLAAESGNVHRVERLLAAGADANARMITGNLQGYTPLHIAAYSGHADVVEFLVTRYPNLADTRIENVHGIYHGFNVLHLAAHAGQVGVVECLVDFAIEKERHGFIDARVSDDNINRLDGYNALHLAVEGEIFALGKRQLEVVRSLLEKAPDLLGTTIRKNDKKDLHGFNALHLAAFRGRLEMVEFLVNEKHMPIDTLVSADNAEDWYGFNALHLAAASVRADVVEFLVNFAFENGKHDFLAARVLGGNESVWGGFNALHLAADSGQLDVVESLLKKDPKLRTTTVQRDNKRGWYGFNALHLAAARGQFDVVESLLKEDFKLIATRILGDNTEWGGYNALHLAVEGKIFASGERQLEVVRSLLEKNLDLLTATVQRDDKKGYHGFNALHLAVTNIRLDVVKFLVNFAFENEKRDFIATRILDENTGGWAHKTALDIVQEKWSSDPWRVADKKRYTDIIEFLLESKQ